MKKNPFEYMTSDEIVKQMNEAVEKSGAREVTEEELIEDEAEFGYFPEDEE